MRHRKGLAELSSACRALSTGGCSGFPDGPRIGNRSVVEHTGLMCPQLCNNAHQLYTMRTGSHTRAHTRLQEGNILQTTF